jgi:hypothetical protein
MILVNFMDGWTCSELLLNIYFMLSIFRMDAIGYISGLIEIQ